ncbi:MAG: ATP-binding protein [Rhodospirillaceae bacterium]|nr:ATP-binding protein [Rhodospirillaceae bacterium]
MRTEYVDDSPDEYNKLITKWCGAKMAKPHSLNAKLQNIVNHHLRNEVTTISIRGQQGTGKTTLAKDIAHLLHERFAKLRYDPEAHDGYVEDNIRRMHEGYIVRVLTAAHLKNFRETLEEMPHRNRILIFDDLSFLNKMRDTKSEVTKVRHLEGGDVKTVMIFNFHYSHGFDKYLRDTPFVFQTQIGNEEIDNMRDVFGRRYGPLITQFANRYNEMQDAGKITIPLYVPGRRRTRRPYTITYTHSSPFRLGLFYNSHSLSYVVYPDSKQLVGACPTCNPDRVRQTAPPDRILAWLGEHFTQRQIQEAMTLLAIHTTGKYIEPHRRSPVHEYLLRLQKNGVMDAADMLVHFYHLSRLPERHIGKIPTEIQADFASRFGLDGLKH